MTIIMERMVTLEQQLKAYILIHKSEANRIWTGLGFVKLKAQPPVTHLLQQGHTSNKGTPPNPFKRVPSTKDQALTYMSLWGQGTDSPFKPPQPIHRCPFKPSYSYTLLQRLTHTVLHRFHLPLWHRRGSGCQECQKRVRTRSQNSFPAAPASISSTSSLPHSLNHFPPYLTPWILQFSDCAG